MQHTFNLEGKGFPMVRFLTLQEDIWIFFGKKFIKIKKKIFFLLVTFPFFGATRRKVGKLLPRMEVNYPTLGKIFPLTIFSKTDFIILLMISTGYENHFFGIKCAYMKIGLY